ncbi:MAG: nitrogen fixation protein NifX [Phormidesmis sp.]
MKVGLATRDSVHINAHFGSASKIDVYETSASGFSFLETLKFGGNLQEDGNEDKLAPKVKALKDCSIVYVLAVGGSAAKRLLYHNIVPIKADAETDEIQATLAALVEILNRPSPPPWLRKALLKGQLKGQLEGQAASASAKLRSQFESAFDAEDSVETIEEEVTV